MFIGKYRRCSKVLHLLRTFPKKVDHAFLLNRVQETAARAVDGRGGPFAGRVPAVSTCLALPHPSMSGVFKRWSPDGCDWLGDTNRAVRRRRVGDPAARRQINRQTARQEQDSTAWVTVHARAGRRPRPPIIYLRHVLTSRS